MVPHNAEPGKPGHGPAGPGLPDAQKIEILGLVPLLAAFFGRARSEMTPQLRRIFSDHGLTARHGAALTQLLPGTPISVSELAERLGVSLSTASELIGDLSRAGLAERREDPANRRRTLVFLAEQHRPAVESFIATRSAPLLRALEGLPPRDRAGFVAGLTAWAREVQAQESRLASPRATGHRPGRPADRAE